MKITADDRQALKYYVIFGALSDNADEFLGFDSPTLAGLVPNLANTTSFTPFL